MRHAIFLKTAGVAVEAETLSRALPQPFKNDSQLLETARVLFELRLGTHGRYGRQPRRLENVESGVRRNLHESIRMSEGKTHLLGVFEKHRLNRLEKEIILFLSCSALGMISRSAPGPCEGIGLSDLQKAMKRKGQTPLDVIHATSQGSRLASAGLIDIQCDDSLIHSEVEISEELLQPLLTKTPVDGPWKVKTYEELLEATYHIIKCLEDRCGRLTHDDYEIPTLYPWRRRGSGTRSLDRRLGRNVKAFERTIGEHPDWPLSRFYSEDLTSHEKLIVMALMGKDLGFVHSHDTLLSGRGLASAISKDIPDMRRNLKLLRRDMPLRRREYVQVCGGLGDGLALEDDETLEDCEFELTDKIVEKLKIKRRRKSRSSAREPLITLDQLVLHPETMEALGLAEAQFKNREFFCELLGPREAIRYGKGVVLLFWGPPGTGKTAAAEGLANRLGKRIIVADYSEIENVWVGQTEKNIVRIFREARDSDAVLFFDEADALFYDRDIAARSWEVRDVNVLLQEIERFDGLCILSTNRHHLLDKALERRISAKTEFPPPTREMRLEIFRKLIPKKLQLAADVDLEELAEEELTGGEMKNVVLNAIRLTLCRSDRAVVTMADFLRAIDLERRGNWDKKTRRVGF